MMPPFARKALAALRSAVVIAIITVLLLEAVLQVAAQVIGKHGRQSAWLHPGSVRILTLGDSNTYGLYLTAEQAYPAVLQARWNREHPERPVEIINLAYPGTNTSRVLKALPDAIRTFAPDLVLVMAGVNDFWMAPVEVEGNAAALPAWQAWLRDHSRVYTLVYLLRRQAYNADLLHVDDAYRHATFEDAQQKAGQWQASLRGEAPSPYPDKPAAIHYGETTFDIGYANERLRQDGRNPAEDMRADFERMADIAAANRVRLAFVTYAYFEMPQKAANQQMKVVSRERGVPLLNATKPFRDECDRGETRCRELFFPDYHPTREGHELIAATLAAQLAALLP